jgi:hypothetical protein
MKRAKQTNCIAKEIAKFEDAWHLLDVNGVIEQQEQVESQDGADVVMCNGALIRLIPEPSNG